MQMRNCRIMSNAVNEDEVNNRNSIRDGCTSWRRWDPLRGVVRGESAKGKLKSHSDMGIMDILLSVERWRGVLRYGKQSRLLI